ncbi:MAG: zinc ribbon domain-containing protein [Candidatus Lokiarchaeota archaeon]|nr:zinc ribbon domain-containing protein [Candidatus Lokiarchaeota archaeon]
MPRGGGGGFRGGGFSGGGFSGGFSGGGFRGSAGSFRVGTVRSNGRPFGRTGATRTVSHPTSGPYRHTYYRPAGRYWGWYGGYYRPWYWRWWYRPFWWAGYYYRPWFYTPAYIGGGLILLIVLPLILLPLFGVAMYFPFSGGISSDGTVTYRSTETLSFNEYWYEYEDMKTGNTITYSFQSSPGVISWAISDESFEELPTTTRNGQFLDRVIVPGNEGYEYILLFLRPGSRIDYEFNASDPIEFFIADTQDMITWNNYGTPVFYRHLVDVTSGTGILNINTAQDYYVVWYNDGSSAIDVDVNIEYLETGVPDLTAADKYGIATDFASGDFTVTSDGRWYFFVYFDPMHSPEETQEITFDVQFQIGKEGNLLAWERARPWLIFFGIVAGVVIIFAVFNRRKQKEFKTTKSDAPGISNESGRDAVEVKTDSRTTVPCPRCGSSMKSTDIYCQKCGEKREGRRAGTETITSRQEICEYCGAKLLLNAKFCTFCGSSIK